MREWCSGWWIGRREGGTERRRTKEESSREGKGTVVPRAFSFQARDISILALEVDRARTTFYTARVLLISVEDEKDREGSLARSSLKRSVLSFGLSLSSSLFLSLPRSLYELISRAVGSVKPASHLRDWPFGLGCERRRSLDRDHRPSLSFPPSLFLPFSS